MRKKDNQEFISIPHAKIKDRIKQLALQYGITFLEQEESYTSKSNFLANDELPIFGEKPKRKPIFSGRRGQKISGKLNNLGRGGYLTNDKKWLNSDCNGAANIIRKKAIQRGLGGFPHERLNQEVMTQLKNVSLAKVTRDVLSRPNRYDMFKDLSKLYRISCEKASFQRAFSHPL